MKNSNKNTYFRQIFEQLQEAGIIVKKHKHRLDSGEYNKRTFADRLGTYTGVIPAIMNGERGVTETIIGNLCQYFGVNEAYIRMGEGPIFSADTVEPPPTFGKRNIFYSAVYATAGDHLTDQAPTRGDVEFGIPGLQGSLFAFDVKGDSMEPILHPGDMVFCRPIESQKEIRQDEIYAIYADGRVRIKYIEFERNSYQTNLKLTSHNDIDHPPIYVDPNQNIKIYHVVHYLTDMGNRLGLL